MFNPKVILAGLAVLLGLLARLLRILLAPLRALIALLLAILGRGERKETVHDRGCIRPPDGIRARPDPYIYSQAWLDQRGLAYTWDNPDFRIVDPDTGQAVDSHELEASKRYSVEATIHNGSLMAALDTEVGFEVCSFGVGMPPLTQLGVDTIDVPAAGSAVARTDWVTPASGGHNCLIATISHHDDANPLNNVGQHNTDVAVPASPERALAFAIALPRGREGQRLQVTVDGYELPENAHCAGSEEERRTRAYLRRLHREHDPGLFPVDPSLAPRLRIAGEEFGFGPPDVRTPTRRATAAGRPAEPGQGRAATTLVHPGGEMRASLVLDPPPTGEGRRAVNLNVFDEDRLLGGLTAYVEEA